VSDAGWRLEDIEGTCLLRCEALESIPGIAHAFSTRIASGRADFDLGPADGESPEVRARRRSFLRAAAIDAERPIILRQIHGAAIVDAAEAGAVPPAADGVIRRAPYRRGGSAPAVRTADCVAILMADRHGSAVAALHAGWRGVAAAIGAGAVARFSAGGTEAVHLVVALGPAIRGCCYEVGDEVVDALSPACGPSDAYVGRAASGRATVDLHRALRAQFVASGVPAGSIASAPFCTRCRNDLFFSFRAEGTASGRLMAAIGPGAGP
jgi:YfiH family protein